MLIGGPICLRSGQLITSSLLFLWRRQLSSWCGTYYLNYHNPSKENPGPLGLWKRSNCKNHSWGLEVKGIPPGADGTWHHALG